MTLQSNTSQDNKAPEMGISKYMLKSMQYFNSGLTASTKKDPQLVNTERETQKN